jgi:hypothetical protein
MSFLGTVRSHLFLTHAHGYCKIYHFLHRDLERVRLFSCACDRLIRVHQYNFILMINMRSKRMRSKHY